MIQVGDRVVCVDASRCYHYRLGEPIAFAPLVEGREYIVYSSLSLPCGRINLDVGVVSPLSVFIMCRCGVQHRTEPRTIWWLGDWRFRKVEERTIEYTVDVKIEIPEPCLS